ncbi:hypothetical protein EV421DRAFT_1906579 [Armillaria borealis]|uniref:MACPF domain-containing protein n=1 Tax=Armillaria borealis TaxID=47425 RepID=A0AA39JC77_9AGAR|nr:hypothetical protein EV421DRAFT_1906579 [Armillaria borealis]
MSLPPPLELQMYLHRAFVNILDNADPKLIYAQYGTHLVSNLIIGGCAAFTCLCQVFMDSLSASEQLKYQDSINSFQESSTYRVLTGGGNSKYGNQNFLNNIDAWTDSVKDCPA